MKHTGIIVSLWLFFGVTHSFLASIRAKQQVERIFGPVFLNRFYRVIYSLIAYIQLVYIIPVGASFIGNEPPILILPKEWLAFVYALKLGGHALILASLLQTDVLEFFGVRQIFLFGTTHNGQERFGEDVLIVRGLFRIVRHPMMLGLMVVAACKPYFTFSGILNFVCIVVYVHIGCFFEDAKLREKFGKSYIVYERCVPKFIPCGLNSNIEVKLAVALREELRIAPNQVGSENNLSTANLK